MPATPALTGRVLSAQAEGLGYGPIITPALKGRVRLKRPLQGRRYLVSLTQAFGLG